MNKLLFVLLAICFVGCVHAFVKRDTGADDNGKKIVDQLENLGKTLKDSIDVEAMQKQIAEGMAAVEPMQKQIAEGMAAFQQTINNMFKKNGVEAPKV